MNLYYSILDYVVTLLVATTVPLPNSDWNITKAWEFKDGEWIFEATSKELPKLCRRSPQSKVHAPIVAQSFHEFVLDGNIIATSGDTFYQHGHALYNILDIHCDQVNGDEFLWRVRTKTQSYAKVAEYPYLYYGINYETLLVKGVSVSMAGGTIFLALFLLLIFKNYFKPHILVCMVSSGFLVGVFLILINPDVFFIEMSPLSLHRTHDAILWVAMIFCWFFMLFITGMQKWIARIYVPICCFAVVMIMSAKNLDQAQVGSAVAFIACFMFIADFTVYALSRAMKSKRFELNVLIEVTCISVFCITAVNDLLINLGLITTVPLFALGFPFVYAMLSILANIKIVKIQRERDHLANNLEVEVAVKTASLKERTRDLESAVTELKKTQAELVHSSKMASLGTLAAGIAHEINNALNYPMGAIPALGRMLSKESISGDEIKKAKGMVDLMKDGLYLTADIIKNLKRYSGQHSSHLEMVEVASVLENTLVLCRNHLKQDVKLQIDIPKEVKVFATKAGLSQVFMNILNNAADAMEKQETPKEITISTYEQDNRTHIKIKDTGPGIPQELITRIFDPFFTTKPEGKGTGLGLFIVTKEIKAFGGDIKVESKIHEGTTFTLVLRKEVITKEEHAA